MKGIYISLGSNLSDREKNLLLAIKKINEQSGTVVRVSSLYTTQPWGVADQPEFLNQVIEITSVLKPAELLDNLKSIEKELGRKEALHWGPRIIDLDILFYGNEIYSSTNLVIPHPGIALRRFVLRPLCELAPDLIHPVLKTSCRQLLKECKDTLMVDVYVPSSS